MILAEQEIQVLYDEKWVRFLKRAWLFRHIPFVRFVLAAGSMALGNVHEKSDFDVIVAARPGRIFTVRLFTIIFFGAFGWRRKKLTHHDEAADKICLNHFVTEASYRLTPPYDNYWKALYHALVPLYGAKVEINKFFAVNDWMGGGRVFEDDLRYDVRKSSAVARFFEWLLGGRLGDWFEAGMKKIQVWRIERGLSAELGYKPRVIYGDTELEFHPDTRRIEALKTVL